MLTDNVKDICILVVIYTIGGTFLFTLVPLILALGEVNLIVVISGCLGFFSGAVCPPKIAPELFINPLRYQVIAGTIAGTIVASVITTLFPFSIPSLKALLIGASIGCFLGLIAHLWMKFVDIPLDF